jgi:hypothetical protein
MALVHVQCGQCGAWAVTTQDPPDGAVRCISPADDPPGSLEGSCCTAGHTHEEHGQYAAERHDDGSQCRPVIITIMGAAHGYPAGTVSLEGTS